MLAWHLILRLGVHHGAPSHPRPCRCNYSPVTYKKLAIALADAPNSDAADIVKHRSYRLKASYCTVGGPHLR